MKLAIIAEIDFSDNKLTQQIIQVENTADWKDAVVKYFQLSEKPVEVIEWAKGLSEDYAQAKNEIADCDMAISVVFVAFSGGNKN